MRLLTISNERLIQFAVVAASAALFFAPFRSSAGVRGGLLILAAAAIGFAHFRAGQLRQLLPAEKLLGVAVAAWLASATMWSFLSPSPLESLSVVKRDILTSVLAFFVFYALTRTRADMMRWISILTAGLVVLTGILVFEPVDPRAYGPARAYVDVGWLTTWLAMVAALIGLLAFMARSQRRKATFLFCVAVPCLVWSAWLSGNRVVWVCYAAVVVVGAGIPCLGQRSTRERVRAALILAGLLALIGCFMAASMQFRAENEASDGAGPVAFLLQDGRAHIWRVAWELIGDRPLLGYGYSNLAFPDQFAAHFDPGWRHLFRHAHNVVLNYMLQMGVIGGFVVLFLFAALIRTFIVKAQSGAVARLCGYSGLALVMAVILRNTTDDFFSRHALQFFGAFVGMLLGLANRRPPLIARERSSQAEVA